MQFFSTRDHNRVVSASQAIAQGLSDEGGLFVPQSFPQVDVKAICALDYPEMAAAIVGQYLTDYSQEFLQEAAKATYGAAFGGKAGYLAPVSDEVYSLELWHGPTCAFKDFGAGFMGRMTGLLGAADEKLVILTATSGDTGSAVANGFLDVEGIDVVVLYPKGKVSEIQEKQFTTLGRNITALEIDGTFDDCQRLVKAAFMDRELGERLSLTSANSINVARFLPQAFYYFNAYARLREAGLSGPIVVSVPSGNFGNLTAGLFAKRMGLPVKRFIAANNRNDIFYHYLQTGNYEPRPSVATIANAMDVGDPSNFARILDLYGRSLEAIRADISAARYDDGQICRAIAETLERTGYLLDPHGACGYLALCEGLREDETGVFLETAHPAKFRDRVEPVIGRSIEIPARLAEFMRGKKLSVELPADFGAFRDFLMAK